MQWLDVSRFVHDSAPATPAADAVQLWLWRDEAADTARRMRDRLLRRLPSQLGGDQLRLTHGAYGKPSLDRPGAPQFNWSHSGTITAMALAQTVELGVDVEQPRRVRDVLALARRYFAPAEAFALANLPACEREMAFYALWTCKEAVLKALGRGIAFGLDRLEFRLSADGQPQTLVRIAEGGGLAVEWQVCRFQPAAGAFGALAWRGPALHVQGFLAAD